LAVQTATRQMFTTLLAVELSAYAHAGDLSGVREVAERITALSVKSRSWNAYRHLAEGYYERLRGDLSAALQAFEKGFPYAEPDPKDLGRVVLCWPRLVAARVETLVALERFEEAEVFGRESLARWRALEFDLGGHEISRALAIAEGKLGHHERAAGRLDALIAEQRELGVAGLNLGASHEARTRIAIWSGDTLAAEEHGRFAAREYRHGRGSPLGARYERLMDEARLAGVRVLPQLSAFETKLANTQGTGYEAALASVEQRMQGVSDAAERARRALRMACDARGASSGHLYLGTIDRLELVATIGGAPDEGLRNAMHEYLRAHAATDETRTAVLTTEGGSLPGTTHAYGRDRPATMLPVLLSYARDGEVVPIGVLALELSERQQTSLSTTPLLEALAIYLARSGDVPGLVHQIAAVE
jgi:hypothetical protein